MTIDLNMNGKDDLEEVMDEMKSKLVESAVNSDVIAQVGQQVIASGIPIVEQALGMDINGDGVIGAPKE